MNRHLVLLHQKMKTKLINAQGAYNIPVVYKWIARNQTGIMNGFMNPPIRDYKTGEWQDSVTGDYGFFIPYDSWEISVRKVEELVDVHDAVITRSRNKQRVLKAIRKEG